MQAVTRLAVGALALLLAVPAGAPVQAKPRADKAKTRMIEGTVRLVPTGPEPSALSGLGSYVGQIKLTPASDGIVVANRLPLERYLLGLAEVPVDWPEEALKAQAIAARTYALRTLAQPAAGAAATYDFDICASIECQVFSGAAVLQQTDGQRWANAVRATADEAILHEGEPILARYHSVSGGRTFDNEQVFETEGSYPYLKGVPSTTEAASPLDRWQVGFTLDDLQQILDRAGRWSSGLRSLREVRTVASREGFHYPDVLFRGKKGRLRLTAEELRVIVREIGPQLFPAKYPSIGLTSSGRLPETFPSNRLTIETEDELVRVRGRGWGHGVGMSQWGAHGMALDGAGYEEILKHYYTGVTLGRVRAPGALDVGIDWGRSSLRVTGAFKVVDERGRTVIADSVGAWTFAFNGSGSMSVSPPTASTAPLSVRLIKSPDATGVGHAAWLTIALSRPAQVMSVTADVGSLEESGAVRRAGRTKVAWLAPLEPGRYSVHVEASSGSETKQTDPVEIVVTEPRDASEPEAERAEEAAAGEPEAPGAPWGLLLFALVFAAAGVFVVTVTMTK
ncbi:MAG: SpoIID/LytB domain-containing protein [Actinomycetota bacterium]